ncbi:cytochrome-c peroxidase [Maribacter sp. ACAM166]|uniref:cytochrome-c peroxidase n=1 Tax=Maribacter sp. ACAM166 TaxID=2508996 RepID=UPI0010FCEE9A|nr:cytochrome c peroxidase [Maribacter sp. ACAM166]TLP82324.1 cytochrome-c peroxidase [Maribacter sp. ACAM166]
MNKNKFIILFAIVTIFLGCGKDDDLELSIIPDHEILESQIIQAIGSLEALQIPFEDDLSSIPSDPKNQLTKEKVLLGKFLFHETGLGKNPKKSAGRNTYSCASCHQSKAGFRSGMKQGIGEGGFGFGLSGEARIISSDYLPSEIDVQPIISPTILNTAYQDAMLWNGQFGGTKTNVGTENNWTAGTPKETNELGFEGLETQAIAGLGVHRLKCLPEMIENSDYKSYFDAAFPDVDISIRYTEHYAGLAIAAYERTVLANKAPFQKWLKGDKDIMSVQEVKGALLFFGKGKCFECHKGPGLNGMEFHALGMNDFSGSDIYQEVDLATKKGRGGFTKNPSDDYKFKTTTLYNLKDVNFFGHGGSFNSIESVINYKNEAVYENSEMNGTNLSSLFVPLGLNETEIKQLTEFVENALYDPNLSRYVPETLPTGNCFPVADNQSKEDMGCD